MHDEQSDDLTPEETGRLAALPRETAPPPELEERVVAGLRAQGTIRAGGGAAWKNAAAVAAMLLLAVSLGYVAGLRAGTPDPTDISPGTAPTADDSPDLGPADGRSTFALLVYGPATPPLAPRDPQQEADAVADAMAWAEELAAAGVLTAAEKLRDETGRLLTRDGTAVPTTPPGSIDDLVLGGFFMIRATDYDDAQRIAAGCPLLRYGDIMIEVRAIEDI